MTPHPNRYTLNPNPQTPSIGIAEKLHIQGANDPSITLRALSIVEAGAERAVLMYGDACP